MEVLDGGQEQDLIIDDFNQPELMETDQINIETEIKTKRYEQFLKSFMVSLHYRRDLFDGMPDTDELIKRIYNAIVSMVKGDIKNK